MQIEFLDPGISLKVPDAIIAARDLAQLGQERDNARRFSAWIDCLTGITPVNDASNPRPVMEVGCCCYPASSSTSSSL
jgi:hypothetical protein